MSAQKNLLENEPHQHFEMSAANLIIMHAALSIDFVCWSRTCLATAQIAKRFLLRATIGTCFTKPKFVYLWFWRYCPFMKFNFKLFAYKFSTLKHQIYTMMNFYIFSTIFETLLNNIQRQYTVVIKIFELHQLEQNYPLISNFFNLSV